MSSKVNKFTDSYTNKHTRTITLKEDLDPIKAQLMGLKYARKTGETERVPEYIIRQLNFREVKYTVTSVAALDGAVR